MPRCSSRGPVSYRGHLPFSESLLREVERITWDVVGHAPTSRAVVRFDRANTYYHARKCGFDGVVRTGGNTSPPAATHPATSTYVGLPQLLGPNSGPVERRSE